MATKQRSSSSRSRSSRKPSSGTRSRSSSTKGRSAAPKGRSASSARRPTPSPLRQAFSGHGHDVWGVALIALGLLAGLGIYADMAGPLGGGLNDAFGALVGGLRILAPVALIVGGALLLRGPRDSEDPTQHRTVRLVVGTAVIVVAVAGLLHLLRGHPESGAPLDDIIHAGGYLGIVVGTPLQNLLASWGAGLVLVALAIVGLVVATGISLRTAASRTAHGVKPVQGVLRRGVDSLFEVGDSDGPVITTDDGITIYDGELDDGPAPKKRRRTKADAMLPELVDDDAGRRVGRRRSHGVRGRGGRRLRRRHRR